MTHDFRGVAGGTAVFPWLANIGGLAQAPPGGVGTTLQTNIVGIPANFTVCGARPPAEARVSCGRHLTVTRPRAAAPGAQFYTVVSIPAGAAVSAAVLHWSISLNGGAGSVGALGGSTFASSDVVYWLSKLHGEAGSGYVASSSSTVKVVERWCAPTAAALFAPVTVTLTMGAAAASDQSGLSQQLSLMVMNTDRCRMAPLDPVPAWQFPAPGGVATVRARALRRRGRDAAEPLPPCHSSVRSLRCRR